MRIGIDIDDTITDTWESLLPIIAKTFSIDPTTLINSLPYYHSLKNIISVEEYRKRIKPLLDDISLSIPVKKDVSTVLKKLKKEGHKIIFITSRGNQEHTNPYEKTTIYLKNNDIPYDKLIIDAKDKAQICKKEKIDLFIDDSNKHCDNVASINIDVLMFTTEYNKYNLSHKHVSSWNEIEKYIESRCNLGN